MGDRHGTTPTRARCGSILVDPVHRIPGVILPGAGDVDEAIEYARETLEASDVERWRVERIEGGTEEVLLDAAPEGELLVVGSRGHGRLSGALIGSISQYLTRHAACPVVVVRPSLLPAIEDRGWC